MFCTLIYLLVQKKFSTRKKRNQQKKQLNQLNETLNDLVIGNITNVNVIENESFESQIDGFFNNAERIVDGEISDCQSQVIGNNFDNKIRKTVDNAVMTV